MLLNDEKGNIINRLRRNDTGKKREFYVYKRYDFL